MGQPVPNVKDNVSRDILSRYLHDYVMAVSLKQYKEAFCARLKGARKSSGYTQVEIAKLLGISRDNYAKYETRSLLRHDLIPAVARITGHDTWFLLTGQSRRDALVQKRRNSKAAARRPKSRLKSI